MNIGQSYSAALSRVELAYEELHLALVSARQDLKSNGNLDFFADVPDIAGIKSKNRKHLLTTMIRRAERAFAPPGGRVSIDFYDVETALHLGSRDDYLRFDPVKAWAHLENTYGGIKGSEMAYRQAAAPIISGFSIKADQPLEIIGGEAVLSRSVYIDSLDKKFSHKIRLSYSCSQSLYELCKALSVFARWASDDLLAGRLESFGRHHESHSVQVISRERFPLGGISVVTFQTRFEFRFSPEMTEKLQEFLSLYGEKFLEAAYC